MVPLGAVATFRDKAGPLSRDALQPRAGGRDRWRYGTGLFLRSFARRRWKRSRAKPAARLHPEWTGIAYQQKFAGNTAGLVFAMAVLFVFLVLAAQYESLVMPLAIILIVPMCLLAAMAGGQHPRAWTTTS